MIRMKIFLIVTTISAVLICGFSALEFKDCGSKIGKFTKIKVSGCDESKSVCVLKRHTNATIDLNFNLVEADTCANVTTVVHGIIMGVEMPFPLPNPNACVNSGLECPLTKGTNYDYVATLPVLKSYPKVKVDVKWELKTENKDVIICVLIPAKIE